ncbi:hypothetical protein ACFLSW_05770 [Candidatus Bipolaricaulota bacterium]
MRNAKLVCLLVVGIAAMLASVGMVAAADDGLDVEIGVEAEILPDFATDLWVDLDWSLDGLSVGSTTTLTVVPALAATEVLNIEYSFGSASLGATANVDLYPFAFAGFTLYADAGLLDTTFGDDGSLSLDVGLWMPILPTFATIISMDIDVSIWLLSLWSGVDFDILTLGIDAWVGGEIRLLDLDFDDGYLTADWGSQMDVLPAFDADMWFDVSFGLGGITVASQTDFALTPFALALQRFDISLDTGNFSVYVWAGYSPTADIFAGIGFTYGLP